MLPPVYRLRRSEDFSQTIRRGGRGHSRGTVVHARRASDGATRFGVIVGKSVGGAVERNLVKRRLRAIASGQIREGQMCGWDVVVRALPGTAVMPYRELEHELTRALRRAQGRAA